MQINGGKGISMGQGRHTPLMGPMAYKTYTLRPRFRKATCAEVECEQWLNGWTFSVAMLAADPQLDRIARNSGRHYRVQVHEGQEYLVFPPGQPCFAAGNHKIQLEEETPLLFVGRGDPRTFDPRTNLPRDARQHSRCEDWVDDFANHQDKLNTAIERG